MPATAARHKVVQRALTWFVVPALVGVEIAWRLREPGLGSPTLDIVGAWIALLGLVALGAIAWPFVKRERYRQRALWLAPIVVAAGIGVWLCVRVDGASLPHFAMWVVGIGGALAALALTDPRDS